MEDTNETREGGGRGRLLRGAALVGLSMFGLTTLVTGALFTDADTVGSNTFSTGTVDLGASPASAVLTMTGMAPGDVVTAPLVVTNDGTLALRYALTSTTDAADADFLASQLQLVVKSGVATCTTAGFDATGAAGYGPSALGSVAGTAVLGDPSPGSQPGDRILAAGASETLCVQVRLPATTGNAYQDTSTTAELRFDAEQTTNNP